MKRTQIQLTQRQTDRLDEVAREEGLSRSELIRRAVDRWLETRSASSSAGKRERARDAVGQFASGNSNVSRKHDEYFADGYGS